MPLKPKQIVRATKSHSRERATDMLVRQGMTRRPTRTQLARQLKKDRSTTRGKAVTRLNMNRLGFRLPKGLRKQVKGGVIPKGATSKFLKSLG